MNHLSKSMIVTGIVLATAAPSVGQALNIYSSGLDAISDLCALDTPVAIAGDSVCPMATRPVPPLTPAPPSRGGITANLGPDELFFTNGTSAIRRVRHPSLGCPGPPILIATLPIPPLFANPITGMTLDASTGLLYLTDGLIVSAHDPAAWPAAVIGPWNISGINFCVGLDHDSCTGHLFGVDGMGNVAEWDAVAGASSLTTLAYLAWPHAALTVGANATGLALNRCIASPCAAMDYYVSWDSAQVVQASTGLLVPAPFASHGLSFAPIPQRMPSPASCLGASLRARVSGYVRAGNPFDLLLCQVPAGIPTALLAVDLNYVPGGILGACGESLWLDPATISVFPAPVAGGMAVFPVPPLPGGLRFYIQWGVLDAAGVLDLSNALNLETVRL